MQRKNKNILASRAQMLAVDHEIDHECLQSFILNHMVGLQIILYFSGILVLGWGRATLLDPGLLI